MFGYTPRSLFSLARRTLPKSVLEKAGIKKMNVLRNYTIPELYEISLANPVTSDPDTPNDSLSSTGAIVAFSGRRYGRSPKDKRVV
jgi:phosphoenolpyruvate carboxykinase (ATP)